MRDRAKGFDGGRRAGKSRGVRDSVPRRRSVPKTHPEIIKSKGEACTRRSNTRVNAFIIL